MPKRAIQLVQATAGDVMNIQGHAEQQQDNPLDEGQRFPISFQVDKEIEKLVSQGTSINSKSARINKLFCRSLSQ